MWYIQVLAALGMAYFETLLPDIIRNCSHQKASVRDGYLTLFKVKKLNSILFSFWIWRRLLKFLIKLLTHKFIYFYFFPFCWLLILSICHYYIMSTGVQLCACVLFWKLENRCACAISIIIIFIMLMCFLWISFAVLPPVFGCPISELSAASVACNIRWYLSFLFYG